MLSFTTPPNFVPRLNIHSNPIRTLLSPHTATLQNPSVYYIPCANLNNTGPILEGDLIAYRATPTSPWTAGAIVEPPDETYLVRPVLAREPTSPDAPLELFIDWTKDTPDIIIPNDCVNVRLLDADPQQRLVQDRIHNPHGEHAEPCWQISRAALENVDPIPGTQ